MLLGKQWRANHLTQLDTFLICHFTLLGQLNSVDYLFSLFFEKGRTCMGKIFSVNSTDFSWYWMDL